MPQIFEYVAQRFRPRSRSDQELLLFKAPAGEIRSWAGVPRKAFDYQHGFQRTLDQRRVSETSNFFADDERNVTPTAIVIGFDQAVCVSPIEGTGLDGDHGFVRIRIEVPDFIELDDNQLIDMGLEEVRQRLSSDVVEVIDRDVENAVATLSETASDLQDLEDAPSDEAGGEPRSYLADFYTQLLGYRQRIVSLEHRDMLRETLYSLLRPAIIVDGQHRVFGAALVDESMQLAVCAMPSSSWAENVYQFVVINQKAKPIKPAFLSTIIATSLSAEEITAVYSRLRTSRVDVGKAEMMERVNTDVASPFKNMIDFEVSGAPGFLQFPGMNRLVAEFRNIPRSHPVLIPGTSWDDLTGDWFSHFFGFWWGIRQYFESRDLRLWQQPSEGNPNSLLKIVTLQEIQRLMLDNWADTRVIKLMDADETRGFAERFWEDFPTTFFTDEWRKKGLQTSVGRRIIRDAIMETRRKHGTPNWGHRRLGLFQD